MKILASLLAYPNTLEKQFYWARQGLFSSSYIFNSFSAGLSVRGRSVKSQTGVKGYFGLNILVLVYGAVSQGVQPASSSFFRP